MSAEKRRHPRRAVRYRARIVGLQDDSGVDCVIADISRSGAQPVVKQADALPDRFILAPSRYGEANRPREVRWRAGDRIGVIFRESEAGRACL